MNISANGKAISTATKELSVRWDDTKAFWQDAKSKEFEQQFLLELASSVERAVPVFDRLQQILAKIREDCE